MAAKLKKRLTANGNKLLKLNKLQLDEVLCSICQSILIQPVTLPCYHDFCQTCFNGSVQNNALCCPLCRLRIGSWLRTATKRNNLVNEQLWEFIRSKFSKEVERKLQGEDVSVLHDTPGPQLCNPGEIRQEYEAELNRLKAERCQLEQKHLQETELLVRKLQEEEVEANTKYLERLKQDELLAKQVQDKIAQEVHCKSSSSKASINNTKLKPTKLDRFLINKKLITKVNESPQLTDDTSTDSSTPKTDSPSKPMSNPSPELVPSYGIYFKNFLDKKIRNVTDFWNKENGISKEISSPSCKDLEIDEDKDVKDNKIVRKNVVQSLPVSLPYKGLLHKQGLHNKKKAGCDSADSMRQELCYFKPIASAKPTRSKSTVGLPLKIPSLRLGQETSTLQYQETPTQAQYLDSLCSLRTLSLAQNLPSAFVLALKILQPKKSSSPVQERNNLNKTLEKSHSPCEKPQLPNNVVVTKNKQTQNNGKLQGTRLCRTRSMGSLTKILNETTPKKVKVKEKKTCSDRKPYLRSDSKKYAQNVQTSPSKEDHNNISRQKINSVVKNLSSPLKNCDVKVILEEQFRIEKIIEQEKSDMELARKIDTEWNRSRPLRRSAVKRQVSLNYTLRPAKKLKV